MMLAMASFVTEFVERKSLEAGLPEAEALSKAFHRLGMAVGAVATTATRPWPSTTWRGWSPPCWNVEARRLLAELGPGPS